MLANAKVLAVLVILAGILVASYLSIKDNDAWDARYKMQSKCSVHYEQNHAEAYQKCLDDVLKKIEKEGKK